MRLTHLVILSLILAISSQIFAKSPPPESLEEFKTYTLDEGSSDPVCLMPMHRRGFKFHDIYNDFDGEDQDHLAPNDLEKDLGAYDVHSLYRYRYLVADLNTLERDDQGQLSCRGIREKHPSWEETPEALWRPHFRDNYEARVAAFKRPEIVKEPIVQYRGITYCMGQTVNVCETDFDKSSKTARVRLVSRFISSTKKPKDYHPWVSKHRHYYAPVMFIAQRGWDHNVKYQQVDQLRDREMGGSKGWKVTYYSKIPNLALPNFLYFKAFNIGHTRRLPEKPDWRWNWIDGNGIHQNTKAVGKGLENFMGSPISAGCVRLTRYASRFVRWYIPRGAKFFFIDDPELYVATPPKK